MPTVALSRLQLMNSVRYCSQSNASWYTEKSGNNSHCGTPAINTTHNSEWMRDVRRLNDTTQTAAVQATSLSTRWVIITGIRAKSGISLLLGHIYGYNLARLSSR